MSDQDSDDGTDDRRPIGASTDGHWIDGPVLDATLPDPVAAALGRFAGTGPVDSVGAWAEDLRRRVGGSLGVDDLCHADAPSPHRGTLDGEVHHFRCFYDAVALAALADERVRIRTESPGGSAIEATATPEGDLSVDPAGAVFSLGVDETAAPDGTPALEDAYAAICPYVRAFPNRQAYHDWRATVPAATVAMPLDGATALAAALVE